MLDLTRLQFNLSEVHRRIALAANRVGRRAAEVALVAVTKYVDANVAAALVDMGCSQLGESRPQELWSKAAALSGRAVTWHLIGHLQRNKIRRTLPCLGLMHSADSLSLLEELNAESTRLGRRTAILLEVNVSGEATKHGFAPREVAGAVQAANRCVNLDLRGLMGMASLEGDRDAARQDFRRLRILRDTLRQEIPGIQLHDLSMGMSGDFEVAIEEGATIIRVGSLLFEGLAQ